MSIELFFWLLLMSLNTLILLSKRVVKPVLKSDKRLRKALVIYHINSDSTLHDFNKLLSKNKNLKAILIPGDNLKLANSIRSNFKDRVSIAKTEIGLKRVITNSRTPDSTPTLVVRGISDIDQITLNEILIAHTKNRATEVLLVPETTNSLSSSLDALLRVPSMWLTRSKITITSNKTLKRATIVIKSKHLDQTKLTSLVLSSLFIVASIMSTYAYSVQELSNLPFLALGFIWLANIYTYVGRFPNSNWFNKLTLITLSPFIIIATFLDSVVLLLGNIKRFTNPSVVK